MNHKWCVHNFNFSTRVQKNLILGHLEIAKRWKTATSTSQMRLFRTWRWAHQLIILFWNHLPYKGPNGERKTINLYNTKKPRTTPRPAVTKVLSFKIVRKMSPLKSECFDVYCFQIWVNSIKTEAVTFKSTQPPTTTTSKTAQTTKKRVCIPCQRKKVPPCRSSPTSKLNLIINHV